MGCGVRGAGTRLFVPGGLLLDAAADDEEQRAEERPTRIRMGELLLFVAVPELRSFCLLHAQRFMSSREEKLPLNSYGLPRGRCHSKQRYLRVLKKVRNSK